MSFELLNSSIKDKSLNNTPSNENQQNQLLSYFFCPKCFKLPSIKIRKEDKYIEIECSCGTENSTRPQSQNEDITKPEVLLELVKYKKYQLILKSYLQLIKLNSQTKKI